MPKSAAKQSPSTDHVTLGCAPPDKRWFSQAEAAAFLGLSVKTLEKWRLDKGPLSPTRIPYTRPGRFPRYKLSDLLAFLRRNRTPSRAPRAPRAPPAP